MNDLAEPKKCDRARWRRTYVASFGFGKLENVAMWVVYGDPLCDAVRMGFGTEDVVAAVDAVRDDGALVSEVKGDGTYPSLRLDKVSVDIHDIVYATGKSLSWDENRLRGDVCADVEEAMRDPEMLGYVKDFAWRYERETRIVVTLPPGSPMPSRIAIPFQRAIEHADIVLGPCTAQARAREFLRRECAYGKMFRKVKIRKRCEKCGFDRTDRCPLLGMD